MGGSLSCACGGSKKVGQLSIGNEEPIEVWNRDVNHDILRSWPSE
jgi:hypothetical protein